MGYFVVRNFLPDFICAKLFGDRKRWGMVADHSDPMWLDWLSRNEEIYRATQKAGVGNVVNEAGYAILKDFDLSLKTVLEIGPGDLPHMGFWRGKPSRYLLVDSSEPFLSAARSKLSEAGVETDCFLVDRASDFGLPYADGSIDVILSFYNLEHLTPLNAYLSEMHRVLKPGGFLVGAIPTEGGIAWGLGRCLTTRRWFKKHTTIDLDKIICWEHPNYANSILDELDGLFRRSRIGFWPFRIPSLDINLVVSFLFTRE
jgi:SAM-dependent methyltransferase